MIIRLSWLLNILVIDVLTVVYLRLLKVVKLFKFIIDCLIHCLLVRRKGYESIITHGCCRFIATVRFNAKIFIGILWLWTPVSRLSRCRGVNYGRSTLIWIFHFLLFLNIIAIPAVSIVIYLHHILLLLLARLPRFAWPRNLLPWSGLTIPFLLGSCLF